MQISYTTTFDEYREANAANGIARRKRRPLVVRLLFFAGMASVGILLSETPISDYKNTSLGMILGELFNASPFLLILVSYLVVAVLHSRAQRQPPRNFNVKVRPHTTRVLLNLLLWLYSFGTLVAICTFFSKHELVAGTSEGPWAVALAPRLPWILLLIVLLLYSISVTASAKKRIWRGSPNDRQQQEVEITAEHIVFTTTYSTLEYKWSAMLCCGESTNLFVVYNSVATFFIIPKRAFADETQLTAFRHMLQNLVVPQPFDEGAV